MEVKFERGGTLPTKKSKLFKTSSFGSSNFERDKSKQKSSKRDHEKKRTKTGENDSESIEIRSAHPLTLTALVPDMILMGMVKSIHPTNIVLNLPGRLIGRVPITNISKSYSDFLKSAIENEEDLLDKPKTLSEMFHVGQILYTRVIDKCHGDKQEILLSLIPEDINFEISSSILAEGSVLLCAIEEIEDHGYFLETGVKCLRGFLPKKNTKQDYKVGELLYCKVQKMSPSIVTFAAFKKSENVKVETLEVPNLKTLVPGSIVNFNVVQVLKNGLEGLLFDGSVSAYVNELYIPRKLAAADSDIIGKEVKARVLYIMPLSNQLFVTLYIDEPPKESDRITYGSLIENAKVIKQVSLGVLFKLGSNEVGFLPKKTILKNFKDNFDIDTAMVKFAPNTTHTIRVRDYNEFERSYFCTNFEKDLKEKFFGTHDLNIGQIVNGKIEQKLQYGLRLRKISRKLQNHSKKWKFLQRF